LARACLQGCQSSQRMSLITTLAPKGLPWESEVSWLGDTSHTGSRSTTALWKLLRPPTHEIRRNPPARDQQRVWSLRQGHGEGTGVSPVYGEGLGAALLAACCVNICRARGGAHPQFGVRVRGTAGDTGDLQRTPGMKGNKKAQLRAPHGTSTCLSALRARRRA